MHRKFKIALGIILAPLVFYAGYYLYFTEQGNFHAITPGSAYRSAQLDGDKLEHYIKKYGIKSILNLRNDTANADWYAREIKISAEYGIKYYLVPLSARKAPAKEDVSEIINIFNSAPRPILIHCKAGADRSGLVAAMWKLVVDKEPKAAAGRQLSIRFFHFPIGRLANLDRFFDSFEESAFSGPKRESGTSSGSARSADK